jgi:hypothetical protein
MKRGDAMQRSPFPGMDPYLEKLWRDVHARLVMYACDQIEPQLPPGLYPQVEERMVMDAALEISVPRYPDVRVMEASGAGEQSGSAVSATATMSVPLIVYTPDPEVTERFVEVREVDGDRLLTVLEVLSPSNKLPGRDRRKYLRKRRELIDAGVNLVEIDLLRRGRAVQTISPSQLPESLRTTYGVYVRRASRPEHTEVHTVPLHERLPVVGVPLRETDSDVALDLQSLIERCYEKGRYRRIDYTADPDPPLSPDDAEWADELLRAKGMRQ